MRRTLALLVLVIAFSSTSLAGEPSYVPYYSIKVIVNLPKPYGKTKLEMICSNASQNLTRQITSFEFITEFGEIPVPEEAYADLRNPGYPKIRAWTPAKELEIWIEFPYQSDKLHHKGHASIRIRNKKVADRHYTIFDESGDRKLRIETY